MNKTSGLAWHVHHSEQICEWAYNIEKRRTFIRKYKPRNEQKTRLHLLKMVRGPLGPLGQAYYEAGQAYYKTRQPYDKTWQAYCEAWQTSAEAMQTYIKAGQANAEAEQANAEAAQALLKARSTYYEAAQARLKARQAYDKAGRAYITSDECRKLHEKECPNCPWNGHTIFPERRTCE